MNTTFVTNTALHVMKLTDRNTVTTRTVPTVIKSSTHQKQIKLLKRTSKPAVYYQNEQSV